MMPIIVQHSLRWTAQLKGLLVGRRRGSDNDGVAAAGDFCSSLEQEEVVSNTLQGSNLPTDHSGLQNGGSQGKRQVGRPLVVQ